MKDQQLTPDSRNYWSAAATRVAESLTPTIQKAKIATRLTREKLTCEYMGQLLQSGISLQLDRIHPQGIRMTMATKQNHAQSNERLVIEAELVPTIGPIGEGPNAARFGNGHDDFTWWAWLERDEAQAEQTRNSTHKESTPWNRHLAGLARAGLLACDDYESWLSWRDASILFENPRDGQECMHRAATAVGIVEAWNANSHRGGIQRLAEELAAESVWMQFEHAGRGLDPDGKLTGVELLVPTERPGTLNRTNISGCTSSQPASTLAMIRVSQPKEGIKRWRLEVNRTGQVVLAGLEHRNQDPIARRRIRKTLTQISEQKDASTWALLRAVNDRYEETRKRENWATGRESSKTQVNKD